MPTNKQRRDAQRRHLERQLERRREREVRRRKTNLVISIAGTLVLVAAIVGAIVVIGGGDDKAPVVEGTQSTSTSPSTSPTSPTAPASSSYPAATGKAVTFNGVTVQGAADLKGSPAVTSKETTAPKAIEVKDLVVGKGTAAKVGDSVTVQYTGVLYKNGTKFDSSWDRGAPTTFTLKSGVGGVIDGFNFGIGGNADITPMKIGGRRIIIVPFAQGYGTSANGAIPASADLVFVVDLLKIGS